MATLGGIGLARPAPGTWGAMLMLPAVLLGPLACLLLAAGVAAVGWWAAREALRETGAEDPSWIVVDEGAGMLLTLAALPATTNSVGLLLAFALFRAFDTWKVGPVGWADSRSGATGVMLDDLVAGALAGAGLLAFHHLWPGTIG